MTEQEKEQVQAEIDKAKDNTIYQTAKAQAETNAMANILTDPNKALQTKLNSKVAECIDNSEIVQQKIVNTSSKLVDSGLKTQENKVNAQVTLSENEVLEADFTKNKDEYINWGLDHKVDKDWKKKFLLIGSDIWFVIWGIISFFTIVPVSIFIQRLNSLKGFVKGIAYIVGILLLLTLLAGGVYYVIKQIGWI